MTWPLPTLFPEVLAGVTALDRAGRWQEALAAALDLYRHFPEEPRACAVLVDMLVALDRADQAHAVLCEARLRFPAEAWIAHRLAELAMARQDWPQALAHWRDAGLPETADPAALRQFARALAHAGEAHAALQLVTSPRSRLAGAPALKLAELELLLQLGRTSDAAACWAELPTDWADPGYAQATCLLARLPEDDLAAPMLAALLAEPDPGTDTWRPTIALALSTDSEALSRRVQAALVRPPTEPGMTQDAAAALTDAKSDTDTLAARIARAVQDGRATLLPLLFETAGLPTRAANLRVALRLYLNRNFADPATLDLLLPASACALLLLARVIDPDCLRYIADQARTTTTKPGPLQLARPQDVLAQIAHTAEPTSPRIRVQRRLRVAICVSGRLPSLPAGIGLARALRLQAHDATVFAHVWRQAGAAAQMAELGSVLRRLPPLLGAALSTAASAGGLAGLRRLYPSLLQARLGSIADTVDEAGVRALFHTDHVTVQDDRQGVLATRPAHWKSRYAAREAHLLAAATGEPFDLCLHIQAGSGLSAAAGIDWHALAETAQNDAVMFAEAGPQFHRVHGFTVGHRFGLGAMTTMGLAAESFTLGEQLASGRVFVHGFARKEAAAHALAMQTHLNGITVRPLAELAMDATPELDPLSPAAALTLLWHDIRARRPASPDKSLIRAAMADVEAPSIPI